MITAATYFPVIATPQRFPDGGRVVSCIGLVPSSWNSGDQQCHGRITKRGSSELRVMPCEAALHAAGPLAEGMSANRERKNNASGTDGTTLISRTPDTVR